MNRSFGAVLPFAVVSLLAAASPVQAQDHDQETGRDPVLEPCDLGGPAADLEGIECGWYPVPEDRADPDGRWIRLRVVRIRSLAENSEPDPIVPLAGGPGQGVAGFARFIAPNHRATYPERDMVLVDQRGTGQSNGLFCASDVETSASVRELLSRVFHPEEFRQCRRDLADQADLSKYVTDIAADDLAEVLQWLGYDRVNVTGGSYGTRMAQVFMRRYPDMVRTAVLDGVVTLDAHSPTTYSPTATQAMLDLIRACSEEETCARAYPDLMARTEAVFRRLDEGPVEVTVTDPRTEKEITAEFPKEAVGYAVRGILYRPQQFVDLPRMLDRAAAGDFTPLAEAYVTRKLGFSGRVFASGMYFSVFCSEDVPYITPEESERSRGTIMDRAMIREFKAICDGWPATPMPPGWHEPVSVDVPTLLFSGEFDPSTTVAMGEQVARALPNSLHLVVRGAGHGSAGNPDGQACTAKIRMEFIQAGTVDGLDVSCMEDIQRPAFRVPEEDGAG